MTQDLKTKAYERGIQAHLKNIAESGSDLHQNHTPAEICDMMLDKLDLSQPKSMLILYNIELLFALKKRKFAGHVTFFTQSQEKADLAPKIFSNLTVEYIDKEENPLYHMETKWPDKFDIIIANPPYGNGNNWKLHIDFLNKSINLAKKQIIFVHPSNQFIVPEEINNNSYDYSNSLIEKNISSITLFNGNFAFGIDKFFPISVTNIDFTKCEKGFILENKITGTSEELDKIQDINLFGNKLVFKNLKSKIKGSLTVSLQDKLKDKRSKTKGNLEKPFIVPISSMRGHPYSKKEQTNKMWKDDFFTFLPLNSQSIESPINLPPFWFEFDTLDESNNFIKFLKTDFARMCLAFMKTDGSINYSMYVIPYMNFTQEWTDEKLYAHFNITEDEQAFIKEVIPPYYD